MIRAEPAAPVGRSGPKGRRPAVRGPRQGQGRNVGRDANAEFREKAMSVALHSGLKSTAFALLCGGALLASSGFAGAQVSFKGKTIDVIMGSAAGGGTDGTTRLVGQFLEKYLPGNPSMRYRNIPGGHGTKGLNFFNKAKPDGLTWAGGSSSHTDPNYLQKDVVEYNPTKFHFFGGVSRGGSIVTIRKEKLPNLTDKSKPPVVVGVIDGNRSWEQMITFGKEHLGWNVKFVIGYSGTPAMILAAMNGEADCMASSSTSQLKPLLDNPAFAAFTQLGDLNDNGKFVPRTAFPNVKVFADMIMPKLSQNDAEILLAWLQTQYIDKWFALPPNTPEPVVNTYKHAFDQAVKDPGFIKAAALQFGEDFGTTNAQNMNALVNGMVKNAQRVDKHMKAMRVKHGLPED